MNATYTTSEHSAELVLKDGRIFRAKRTESPEDFYVRIANLLDEESGDVLKVTKEVTEVKLKKLSLDALKKKLTKATPFQKELIMGLLRPDGHQAPKRAKKEKTKPSDKEVLKAKLIARSNIGKQCMFPPKNEGGLVLTGKIHGVQVDKRCGYVYYRIFVDGKQYHKKWNAKGLKLL
jgi:hypothetical protein